MLKATKYVICYRRTFDRSAVFGGGRLAGQRHRTCSGILLTPVSLRLSVVTGPIEHAVNRSIDKKYR